MINPNDLETWPNKIPPKNGYYFYYHEDYPVPDIVWVGDSANSRNGRGYLTRNSNTYISCDERCHFFPTRIEPYVLAEVSA